MPNYYAHLNFGGRVLEALPAPLSNTIQMEREAFDLGCLGPDPLFFYRVLQPGTVRREGLETHRHSALPSAKRLRRQVEQGVPMSRGYGAGFLCHLALDSTCHKYIYRRMSEGDITHLAMEGEFDRLLLETDGKDSLGQVYLPEVETPAVWTAVAGAYMHVSPRQAQQAYRAMARYTRMLAGAYGKRRGRLLDAVSHLPACGRIRGMVLQREPSPASAEVSRELLTRLEGAVPETAKQINAFFAAIAEGTSVPAWFDRDFRGNPPACAAV